MSRWHWVYTATIFRLDQRGEDRFPGAKGRLDYYHAAQHIHAVARELFGEDEAAGSAWTEPLGSGAIESTCRQHQCRFKCPGQFWTTEGDEALLTLEVFWRNGRWRNLFSQSILN